MTLVSQCNETRKTKEKPKSRKRNSFWKFFIFFFFLFGKRETSLLKLTLKRRHSFAGPLMSTIKSEGFFFSFNTNKTPALVYIRWLFGFIPIKKLSTKKNWIKKRGLAVFFIISHKILLRSLLDWYTKPVYATLRIGDDISPKAVRQVLP